MNLHPQSGHSDLGRGRGTINSISIFLKIVLLGVITDGRIGDAHFVRRRAGERREGRR